MVNNIIKLTPESFLRIWLKFKWKKNDKFKALSTQQIFSKIYDENIWGKDNKNNFCSGPGTIIPNIIKYISFLKHFIKQNKIKNIIDLGCGDYRIMKVIMDKDPKLNYTGIDIVPQLIDHNQKIFGSNRIKFVCLNAITDEMPGGDLIIVRQVLQHLNNSQIQLILKKLIRYKYVLISEHLPTENITPNIDKLAGPKNRLFFNSGIFLNKPPFSIKAKRVFELKDADYHDLKNITRESVIATYLIEY